MKIESIYHSKESRRKECKGDIREKRHSKDPVHHPMLIEREYVRALNSTKLERMLSKPFITALSHHREGVNHLKKSYSSGVFASSSYDNQVVVWDLFSRSAILEQQFPSVVNDIAVDEKDDVISLFVAQNKTVAHSSGLEFITKSTVSSLDFNGGDLCAGHSQGVSVFDASRVTPKYSYLADDISFVKFNRSFKHILAGVNRLSVNLYDSRSNKMVIDIEHPGTNCLSFNPQEGYEFSCGNEDGNGYLYDIRNYTRPTEIYRGHTNAIVGISFSPDGREVVTGSFDRTIRIFRINDRKARDCYYNDRMQIVHAVEHSNDGDFIISGSDDGSLRLWKAHADKKTGPLSRVEKESLEYAEALKRKFEHVGEIARIGRHRFLNKEIKHEMRIKHEMHEGKERRASKREREQEFKLKNFPGEN